MPTPTTKILEPSVSSWVSPRCVALAMGEVKQEVPGMAAVKVALAPHGLVNCENCFPNNTSQTSLVFHKLYSHIIFHLKVPPANLEKDKEYSLKAALTARMEEVGKKNIHVYIT